MIEKVSHKKMGDVFLFRQGIQRSVKLQSEELTPGKVRFIRIIDFTQGAELPRYIDNPGDEYLISEKDVSLVRYGASTGFVCSGIAGALANNLFRVIPVNKESVDLKYLFYFLNSPLFQDVIRREMGGAAMPAISFKMVKKILFPDINISEQKAIVKILDEAFAKIDQAKANIEKNIENAKDLFQSKLNEIFSQRGEGWEEKTLIEIAKEFGRGKSKHRPRNDESLFGDDYPFVQTGEVRNSEKYIRTYSKSYNNKGLAQSKLWPKSTICITIAANIAETAILDFDACFPDSIIGLIVDPNKSTNDYTFYALQYLKSDLQAQGKGSAQDNINLGTFKKQLFPFPNIETQKEIVIVLDEIRAKSKIVEKNYRHKIVELDELKKSLLQKAFSGELV